MIRRPYGVIQTGPLIGQTSFTRVTFHCSAGPTMNGLIVEPGS